MNPQSRIYAIAGAALCVCAAFLLLCSAAPPPARAQAQTYYVIDDGSGNFTVNRLPKWTNVTGGHGSSPTRCSPTTARTSRSTAPQACA